MTRDESVLVYATLRDLIFSFPQLVDKPRFVPDYTPEQIMETGAQFPAVGLQKFHDGTEKRMDKHEEYCRTTDSEGNVLAWFEAGRFDFGVTAALFMSSTSQVPNPVPFLRAWQTHIRQRVVSDVRFPLVGDPVLGETCYIEFVGDPFDQHGKLLYSTKLSLKVRGKILLPMLADPPPADQKKLRIIVTTGGIDPE